MCSTKLLKVLVLGKNLLLYSSTAQIWSVKIASVALQHESYRGGIGALKSNCKETEWDFTNKFQCLQEICEKV